MSLPPESRCRLGPDLEICRILNGMWQVSGAHGAIDPERAVGQMLRYHEIGFTSWDLADHYGPAEDFVGEFRRRLGPERSAETTAFTKWVPYPGRMSREVVEAAVDLSRRRMAADCLDLLQFHWWEYGDERYFDALAHLAELAAAGKIRHLGLTNFDTERLAAIAARGIRIVSNQVQYSLVDRRPEQRMAAWCEAEGVRLLAYGTLLGGLLSEKYLGRAEPGRAELATASLQKYKRMIDTWGGWALFQELLAALKSIADKHRVAIANVGIRYVLDQRAVAGVIVGARLGIAEHIEQNARSFGFALDAEDLARIEAVAARSHDLMRAIGDCGDEYR
ncbi:MAG TPA: aldo/keto reductase [Stellaceae bacterium]|nr:aldo/keto reductase [Stellaceae bacterium]